MRSGSAHAGRTRWIGLNTLLLRECRVILRFWGFTLAPPAITTILYLSIFGDIIGKRIGAMQGVQYIQFLAPGLILLWVIPFAYGHTAAGFMGARIFGFLDELLVSPLPAWIVMTGYVISGVIRGCLVGSVAVIIALLFTWLPVHSASAIVASLVLAALVSALGGFITALFAKSFDQVNAIQTLVLTPLTYLGGVFNPASTLPPWAQTLSLGNPMFYMVNAFRYGFLGVTDVPARIAMSVMLMAAVILFSVAYSLVARGTGFRE